MSGGKPFLSFAIAVLFLLNTPSCGQTVKQIEKSAMRSIYEEDQKNRNDFDGDAKRRDLVRQLIAGGKVQTAEDYYYAAFIFQHGQQPSDYLYSHLLAVTAVDKGLHNATWLSAAALDRYLHSIQQPQVFGTQFGNPWADPDRDDQEPYDRKLVSDQLRTAWCVSSLAEQENALRDLRAGTGYGGTGNCPLPDAQFDKK